MPCQSDPGEISAWDRFTTAIVIFNYVAEQVGEDERLDSHRDYGLRSEDILQRVCGMLKGLPEAERDAIVYAPRIPAARRLADWWERHLETDRRREAEEAAEQERARLIVKASAKLTPEELRALGLKPSGAK